MKYNKTERTLLAGLVFVLLVGGVLLVPEVTSRLGGGERPDAKAMTVELSELPPEETGAGLEASTEEHEVPESRIYVHVAGAVAEAGVVAVPEGTRLFEAVAEAGGALDEAAVQYVNLATPLEDGQLVYIPTVEELRSGQTREGIAIDSLLACAVVPQMGREEAAEGAASVDINSASIRELVEVPGIGPTLAQRIVTYREQSGGFGSVEELVEVKGIGSATLSELREYVYVR